LNEGLDVSSMGQRVHAVLRERILEGVLAPGSRLHQAQLSQELGVSRTPLREALGRLAAEGLVELLPQKGARVAQVGRLDMDASYDARLIIEPAAAALAAGCGDAEALADMKAAIAEHRASVDDPATAFGANRAFHLALVRGSGNPFLLRFAQTLWVGRLGLSIYGAQRETPAFIRKDADDHEAIARAVADGDAALAERLTREHIARGRARRQEALAADPAA
jgi:DNA-binding GntR family transcriptional regulator